MQGMGFRISQHSHQAIKRGRTTKSLVAMLEGGAYLMGVSENSLPSNLASRTYLKCDNYSMINDKNLLDFPDSFSILTRSFKFSDRPLMAVVARVGGVAPQCAGSDQNSPGVRFRYPIGPVRFPTIRSVRHAVNSRRGPIPFALFQRRSAAPDRAGKLATE